MPCFWHKTKMCVLQWISCKIMRQHNEPSGSRATAVYN